MNSYNELPKVYSPSEFEERIYKNWCDKGYFTPDVNNPAPAFSIVIPPPNVTGQLHMGHALDETLQDIQVCIPDSPRESGLVSKVSKGLRSPFESRRAPLGTHFVA